jgi:hypothetical protein
VQGCTFLGPPPRCCRHKHITNKGIANYTQFLTCPKQLMSSCLSIFLVNFSKLSINNLLHSSPYNATNYRITQWTGLCLGCLSVLRKPLHGFRRNLLRILCHWRPPQSSTTKFLTICNKNKAYAPNCEVTAKFASFKSNMDLSRANKKLPWIQPYIDRNMSGFK